MPEVLTNSFASPMPGSRRSVPSQTYGLYPVYSPLQEVKVNNPPRTQCLQWKSHPQRLFSWVSTMSSEIGGGCTLLPLLHVCSQWRESALDDSSLWVAFYLSNVTPPFLDVILAHPRDLVLNVSFDGQDVKYVGRVQYLLDKTEEFGLSTSHLMSPPWSV